MLFRSLIQFVLKRTRHFFYIIWANCYTHSVKPDSRVSIDVIIPVIETDLAVLPLCIEGLRKNVCHAIKDIYLVAPDNKSIKDFARVHGVIFLDEATLLEYSPAGINYIITAGTYKGLNRSGWIYQQLVKLSGRVGTCRYYLAIDADHILLKPHVFITENKSMVFYQSGEYNRPYYNNIKKLLKFYPSSLFSYVSHKMIFDKEDIKQLHSAIESKSGTQHTWDKIILSSLNSDEVSGFSEFELYGNFVAAEKKVLLPWKEKMLSKNGLKNFDELQRLYPEYLSLTFPSYLNETSK